jgi:hypothetical protein
MKLHRLTWACVGMALLLGCERPAAPDALFPLTAGHEWTYRVTTRLGEDASDRETLTLRSAGEEVVPALGGISAWHRRSDSGLDYWLKSDETGIYRIASKSDLDPEPKPDKPHRYVLKTPYVIGTQWQSATTAYLLMRRNEFPRELRHTHPSIPMAYVIDSVNESLDTPAGHFDRCVRVKGTATVRVYADPATGWRDMALFTTEWYCAGVGLVKLERNEPAGTAFLTGGTRTLELQSWK